MPQARESTSQVTCAVCAGKSSLICSCSTPLYRPVHDIILYTPPSEQQTGKPILFAHNISPEALQKHCKDEHIGEWTLFRAGWGDLDA